LSAEDQIQLECQYSADIVLARLTSTERNVSTFCGLDGDEGTLVPSGVLRTVDGDMM
jgi:hypothetical protein